MRGLNSSRCAVGLWGIGLNFRWLWGVVESGRDRAQCRFVDEWNRNKTSRIKMCILSSVCVTYRWRHDFVRAARATPTWMDFVLSSFAPNCPCVVRLFFTLFIHPSFSCLTLLFLHAPILPFQLFCFFTVAKKAKTSDYLQTHCPDDLPCRALSKIIPPPHFPDSLLFLDLRHLFSALPPSSSS